MKFPKIDTNLIWTMGFAAALALLLLLFFGLAYWISWWFAYMIWFALSTAFLYPVLKRVLEWESDPTPEDVFEEVIDMLTEEDDDENTKTAILDSIDDL